MTYQQRAIEFFTTTGEEWWVKNQIVSKLKDLAKEEKKSSLVAPNLTLGETHQQRLDIQSDSITRMQEDFAITNNRLERLETYVIQGRVLGLPPLGPKISSPPDDDAQL